MERTRKIYGYTQSGNGCKSKLLASLLELDHEWVQVNPLAGETCTAGFLSKNPNGKIPLLELDDGCFLSESNAILNCLAAGSEVRPAAAFAKAKVATAVF